ncbi:MAG: DUF4097 family beta strand repeat protein [Deltaproteobacteria bacterium]|nr:DUF4097 family beta strand repeat protein [Deltaproteobacteria bacterium]
MNRKGWKIFFVTMFIVCAAASSFAATITKYFEEVYDFNPGGDVIVRAVNGGIELSSWSQDKVEIVSEVKVRAGSRREAEDLLEEVEIVVDYDSDRIRVEADYPKHLGKNGFFKWAFGSNGGVWVRYWIKVPEKTNIDLKTVNGGIETENVEGKAELRTTNGGIEASDIKGSISVQTTNGSVRVKVDSFSNSDEITIRTVNGSVRLALPSNVSADLEAGTVNGSIRTDFPLTVRGRLTKRNLDGKIKDGGGSIILGTVNGSVTVSER